MSDKKEEIAEEKILATVQLISEVVKHDNADSLYVATVLGWNIIINPEKMFGAEWLETIKNTKIVYVEIDSVLPPIFEQEAFWKYLTKTHMGRKVSTAKLRGLISQGLILDLGTIRRLFPDKIKQIEDAPIGTNVTNDLAITKYYSANDVEAPLRQPRNQVPYLDPFPTFLIKTDQPRLQNCLKILQNCTHRTFTATQKYDGQSVQWFFHQGKVGVCSRNYLVQLDRDNGDSHNDKFRIIAKKYDIFAKLANLQRNISIHTEMYGPGINGNRHNTSELDIAVFDIYDIDRRQLLPHNMVIEIALKLQLPTVQVVFHHSPLFSTKIKDWTNLADQQRYSNGEKAEGIVVKTDDDNPLYVSFKVISPNYLLEHDN